MLTSNEDAYTDYLEHALLRDDIDEGAVRSALQQMGFDDSSIESMLGERYAWSSTALTSTSSTSSTDSSLRKSIEHVSGDAWAGRTPPPFSRISAEEPAQQPLGSSPVTCEVVLPATRESLVPDRATAEHDAEVTFDPWTREPLFDANRALSRQRRAEYMHHLAALQALLLGLPMPSDDAVRAQVPRDTADGAEEEEEEAVVVKQATAQIAPLSGDAFAEETASHTAATIPAPKRLFLDSEEEEKEGSYTGAAAESSLATYSFQDGATDSVPSERSDGSEPEPYDYVYNYASYATHGRPQQAPLSQRFRVFIPTCACRTSGQCARHPRLYEAPATSGLLLRGAARSLATAPLTGRPINREPVGVCVTRQVEQVATSRRQDTARATSHRCPVAMVPSARTKPEGGRLLTSHVPSTLTHKAKTDRVRLAQQYQRRWEATDKKSTTDQREAVWEVRCKLLACDDRTPRVL